METQASWNPWHGCRKLSEGCRNCYVYRLDARHGGDASLVRRTADFSLPVKHTRGGAYRLPPGTHVWTCFTSDFLLDEADPWRAEAWAMMRERRDLHFTFITKRIDRLSSTIPPDWGAGYDNVTIGLTVENMREAQYRLPIYRDAPIRHRFIACEPLLERVDLMPYLGPWAESVAAGGESGDGARPCDYEWVLDLRRQCVERSVAFTFRQTGANFIKGERAYRIARKDQHAQAKKANIDFSPR